MPPRKQTTTSAEVTAEANVDVDTIADEYGFEFSAPPVRESGRSSKYTDRWQAARKVCEANPGRTLKVHSWTNPSQPYNFAKAINNGEHPYFKDGENWTAVGGKDGDVYSLWLTFKIKG